MLEPLVTIGIPTYNRPDRLKKTLECITNQSYKNLEIIVSDNASPGTETRSIVEYFSQDDHRITYFRQDENKGACFNFMFVLKMATADYFMWAADDDHFESIDLVEKLVHRCTDKILVFPNFNLFDSNQKLISKEIFTDIYGNCKSKYDYFFAWCRNGDGYPVYGLYNLNYFRKNELSFNFDNDLIYFNEGTFLHQIFLTGEVNFISDIFINISKGGSVPSNKIKLLQSYLSYVNRVITINMKSSQIPLWVKISSSSIFARRYIGALKLLITILIAFLFHISHSLFGRKNL